MKMLILALLGAIIISCSPRITFVPKKCSVGMLSFKKYSEEGFLFTSDKYMGDYEAVGLIDVSISPSAELTSVSTGKNSEGNETYKKTWNIDIVNLGEGLDSLFFSAKSLGANAIVNLDIEVISNSYNIENALPDLTISGYRIKGFAIKRLGAFSNSAQNRDVANE